MQVIVLMLTIQRAGEAAELQNLTFVIRKNCMSFHENNKQLSNTKNVKWINS